MLDGVYLNRDGAAVSHEAAPPSTDELEAVLLKIIKRTMQLLTRLGSSHRRTRGELPRRNGQRWGAEVSASRLVHLSDCARSTGWAKSTELG